MTATLSVAAGQARSTWVAELAVAVRLAGAPGGVVSGGGPPPTGVAMSVASSAALRARL